MPKSRSLKLGVFSFQKVQHNIKIQIFQRCYFYRILAIRVADKKSGVSLIIFSFPSNFLCFEAFNSFIHILEIQKL